MRELLIEQGRYVSIPTENADDYKLIISCLIEDLISSDWKAANTISGLSLPSSGVSASKVHFSRSRSMKLSAAL